MKHNFAFTFLLLRPIDDSNTDLKQQSELFYMKDAVIVIIVMIVISDDLIL